MPRILRKHVGHVATCAFVLAVSTGVNLVVFAVANALWIRPLPFPEPERVVTFPGLSFGGIDSPALQIFDGGVAGQVVTNSMSPWLRLPRLEIVEVGQDLETLTVTSGYFRVLGLAIRGRDFRDADERDGAEPVAIISDRLWSRAFGRRTDVIGAVLPAKPLAVTVVGVAPAGFNGARRGEQVDLWIPVSVGRRIAPSDASRSLMVLARLGPGQTPAMMAQRFESLLPNVLRPFQTTVTPITEVFGTPESPGLVIRERAALLIASGLAVLVLLGACATIAALVLMHYEGRRGELAVKVSLGASRRRLVLELAHELSLIAVTGIAGGILVAGLGVQILSAFSLPQGVDIGRLDLSIDWRVYAVAVATIVLTLVSAAALPIARSIHCRLAGELLTGPAAITLGSLRVRQVLLAVQVCTTIIVLVAAALFVRAVVHGFGRAAGFDIDRTVFVSVAEAGMSKPLGDLQRIRARQAERSARLMPVLRALPSVSEVAEGNSPIGPDAARSTPNSLTIRVRDRNHQLAIGRLTGGSELLSVLGVPILAGRSLIPADREQVPAPAVITQSLAQRLWPDGGALGDAFTIVQVRGGSYVVVGICRDMVFGSLARPAAGVVVTAGPGGSSHAKFVIRTDQPEIVAGVVRRAMQGPGRAVRVATGREMIARDIGRQRLGAWAFSGFGLVALLLGVGGAFALVSYLADSRRREFGVRMALGADHRDLLRQGVIAAMAPVSAGVAAGLALGATISRVFEALLVGISPFDPVTYLVVAMVMLSCAAIAALTAAWRLRRTTPSEALRA